MAYLEGDRGGSAPRAGRGITAGSGLTSPTAKTAGPLRRIETARLIPIAIALLGLALWEVAVRSGWIATLFFPAPSTIAATISRMLADGSLLLALGTTLRRMFLGLLIGGGAGTVLGLAMGMSRSLRLVLEPFVAAAHPVPKIAIFPLILIMFGAGESSKVAICSLAAFFPMLINTLEGVTQIHPIYFEVAQNYGANQFKVITRVVLPGSLHAILTALLLAMNITLLLTLAVEMIGSTTGLGATIWLAWQTMRTEELYASLTAIILLGIGFNALFHRLVHLLAPWHPERER